MNGHSYIGASSAARWLACPGSVRLYKELTQRRATIYAATGTVAHELCEKCLLENRDPLEYLGKVFEQDGFQVEVTDQMAAGVRLYKEHIRLDLAKFGGELVVEQSFDLSWVYPGMYGRNDASIIPAELFSTLRTYDYKNGRSNVDAKENPQLMYYALGALGEHNVRFVDTVEVAIIQPNASDGGDWLDKWDIKARELYAWAMDVLRPGAAKTELPDAPLCEGEHCHFCEAAAHCPLKQSKVMELLSIPVDTPVAQITLPAVQSIGADRIGLLSAFFNGPEFDAWRKSLAAEEMAMLSRGVRVPGRKLVEKTVKGNRRWVSEDAVITALKDILGDELFTQDVIGPAPVERLLTARGYDKAQRAELISPLVTRDENVKVYVTSDSDSTPAIAERREEAVSMFN